MPLGTAQETSTPSRSRRRSQCKAVAWCSWTTKRGRADGATTGDPAGSGVSEKSRLARYWASRSAPPEPAAPTAISSLLVSGQALEQWKGPHQDLLLLGRHGRQAGGQVGVPPRPGLLQQLPPFARDRDRKNVV